MTVRIDETVLRLRVERVDEEVEILVYDTESRITADGLKEVTLNDGCEMNSAGASSKLDLCKLDQILTIVSMSSSLSI